MQAQNTRVLLGFSTDLDDGAIARAVRNLGGHDLGDLLGAFARS